MCVNACLNMSRAGDAWREELIRYVETGIRNHLSRQLLEIVDNSLPSPEKLANECLVC